MSRQTPTAHFHKSKTLDNKYMLGDEIGKGAYGRVYKGLDLENGDFVAIKQVSLENIAQEDLNIIMNLNHKNIVKYLGSLKTKSHLHIILEYVENGSLANIIKPNKFGPFPESLVTVYIAQVLEGLVYLHEQGVIHRDIKGANILTTKEGLVKLADFGVATKLTEADVNTHSVVGTPYWMAPEVIEMSGVCAASDIWSVGCTVIELLTCVPPYYDLQPMPALFRIVQDDNPPIPDSLSPDITDFLRQCFKKDARQRPDAKTLLSHPWILNSRRALNSLRHNPSIRNIQEGAENGDIEVLDEDRSTEKAEAGITNSETGTKTDLSAEMTDVVRSDKNLATAFDVGDDGIDSDQVPTLTIRESLCPQLHSDRGSEHNGVASNAPQGSTDMHDHDDVLVNGNVEFPDTRRTNADKKTGGKGNAGLNEGKSFGFLSRSPDNGAQKAVKGSVTLGGNELSRFSDTPGDASLDDLFHPLDKTPGDRTGEASTSASTSHMNQDGTPAADAGKHDLATKLRATIAQKQMENEAGKSSDGGDLFRVMMGVLKDDVIDFDGLGFDEKLPAENLFPLQVVEFSRLVGSLRPEEPEEVIASACQKLVGIFHQRSEQKLVFITQHGLLPLMELLEVPKTRVICSVLQLINQIVKDNTDFQENACLVGLIPVVMSFSGPDRPREVRMEAAYFLQQLCQSSFLTLQMFIACRGIPVLVGFLEADYAKFREMVHLAINGMWQVFKLQRSTPRNDFCRIAAKNGILLRLINTLYSLNEATRLATISGGTGVSSDGSAPRPRSGQLDSSHPVFVQSEASFPAPDLPDGIKSRHGMFDHPSSSDAIQSETRYSNTDADRPQMSSLAKLPEADKAVNIPPVKETSAAVAKERDSLERWKAADGSRSEADSRQRLSVSTNRISADRPLKLLDSASNEVSGRGKENDNLESAPRISQRTPSKKNSPLFSTDGAASTSGVASQTASGVLSGSGVLNARPGSATSSGLLSHMVSTMNADVAREYLEKVADLLLEFAQADTTVKSYMCSQSLLSRLFQMFNRIEPPILLKILKCINNLSCDPNCLENLQRADAIKFLIPNLELKDGPLVGQIHDEVLHALFNLCKINKRRQEQAAENGIIPHLMNFIMQGSRLKQYALPLLCDMAHASRNSREQLRAHGGLDVYLSLLDDASWSVTALDSIAVCLAHDNDNRKVEQALLKKDAVHKLVKFFQSCPEQQFVHILEPFLKIITKSSRINTTLAVNGLTPLLIARLDHQDAIARLNLLKLIKAVYEHHPRPKQLIVENDLPQKLQNLIEERRDGQSSGGQVLVKQMATSLLKALHINTVL
ncbi:unnamed protein product [Linum tenue]|uniref:non-specific serine/threonine protein kinase n=1 Tax=Linum tenue TaxID=586396 RepID=A0AAV0GZG7_9ROSI|nr:unnamed protein product [Linum tenue]